MVWQAAADFRRLPAAGHATRHQFAVKPIGCRLRLAVLQHCLRLVFGSQFESELASEEFDVVALVLHFRHVLVDGFEAPACRP